MPLLQCGAFARELGSLRFCRLNFDGILRKNSGTNLRSRPRGAVDRSVRTRDGLQLPSSLGISRMPFIGRDWRSPGEAWVKTGEGWEKKKILEFYCCSADRCVHPFLCLPRRQHHARSRRSIRLSLGPVKDADIDCHTSRELEQCRAFNSGSGRCRSRAPRLSSVERPKASSFEFCLRSHGFSR